MQESSTQIPTVARLDEASATGTTLVSWSSLGLQRSKIILSVIALLLLLIALVAVIQSVSFEALWASIRTAHIEWIIMTILLVCTGQLLRIVRFKRLLEWDRAVGARAAGQATLIGQVINWLSPIRVGDIWRIWRAAQNRPGSLLWTTSAVVVEKSADSLVLAAFAGALLLAPLPEGFSPPVVRLLVTALAGALLVSGLSALSSAGFRRRLLKFMPKVEVWLDIANATSPSDLVWKGRAERWLEMLSYSALIWTVAILTNIALAQAFDIHIGLASHVLLLLALQTTSVFSPVPGNVGIFSLVSLGVLTTMGVSNADALAYGSVLYVVVYGTLLTAATATLLPPLRPQPASSPVQHAPHS
ncbi:MAG: lysylphosphatidylglycerol synthase transmembrane domain-containing protein [Anaerolineae bacterium]|nr:flippase-like domain-containing protein [Candidatus Roseilinea sp.]MDW8451332.1 lysylphosphatidylglycerol synthase transmembrane domain-containing protein [Anaerolineae bacterium]